MKSDIEIAQACPMRHIREIAREVGVEERYLEQYGNYKAKIDDKLLQEKEGPDGKLILVTAITPTPAGEGKTTTTVGLADGLRKLGKKSVVALREPSLGPVFGLKGGAAGGGYAQVVPMEDINLHFTGDFHAIGAANNLLAAMLDNHIQQGNALGIDVKKITWKRCVDMNDRQLRNIVDGLGGRAQGVPREDGFDITVASEIMAVLCLATSITDLKARLGRMVVGYTYEDKPVTANDLKAAGAMAALLKDAIKPNLVQTLEGTPALIHGGPFANIAHGCNSIMATRAALKLGDYAVTEAGFGADLGAEKFLDIKCRMADLQPSAVVVVATVRALKHHGGVAKADLGKEDLAALERARQQGVLMVPVTGRPAQGLPPAVLSLPGLRYAVTSNGATIRDLVEQRVLLEKHLAPALCLQVLARCAHIPMIRQVFRAGVGYLSRPDYETLRARYAGTAMLQYHLDTRQVLPGTVEEFLAADARPVEELFFLTDSPQTKQALRQCLADLPGIGFADPFPNDLEVIAGE